MKFASSVFGLGVLPYTLVVGHHVVRNMIVLCM